MLKELPSLLPVAEELVKTLSGQIDAGQIGLKEAEEQIVGFIHCIGHLMVLEVVEKVSEPTTENRLRVGDQVAVYKDIKSQRLSCLCPKRSHFPSVSPPVFIPKQPKPGVLKPCGPASAVWPSG